MIFEEKQIVLVSKEGDRFQSTSRLANMSSLIKNIVEEEMTDEVIPLHQISSNMLSKMLEFAQHHSYLPPEPPKKPVPVNFVGAVEDPWDENWVKSLSEDQLIEMIKAANFLDFKSVFDLCACYTASLFKGKSIEELRAKYGIQEEFTEAEEARIKQENPWTMEDINERLNL